jgi:hypothetical protein
MKDTGNVFTSVYDLLLIYSSKLQSDDSIIEPGETVQIVNMQYENTGGMYTPIY